MNKSLILWIFALIVGAASSFAQSCILMDTYNTLGSDGPISFGSPDIPWNGVSGAPGTVGTPLPYGWMAGLYYAPGDITGSIAADPTGYGLPTSQNLNFILGTGTGSTAVIGGPSVGGLQGWFLSASAFQMPVPVGSTITVEVVAYSGSSYETALYRGHSTAFTITTSSTSSPAPNGVGNFMNTTTFSVFTVPEPSVLSLAGISGAALLLFRRRGK